MTTMSPVHVHCLQSPRGYSHWLIEYRAVTLTAPDVVREECRVHCSTEQLVLDLSLCSVTTSVNEEGKTSSVSPTLAVSDHKQSM